ncbi:MAG: dockerin type I repeat-containing protein [Candidatus Peribacter sp.]|nr:dockerin type I repeat-containing protein [Candidatus Peribacter sp.]
MHITYRSRQFLRALFFSGICVAASFLIGIQSAGEVQPIALIEAGSVSQSGDLTGDGGVDVQDVIQILEVVQGYAQATPDQLKADPNGDGSFTIDDALRILRTLP